MKTMTSKAMELINKVNSLMAVDIIRLSVWKVFDIEIEGIALILVIKYAMIATETRGYHGTMIIAAIILGMSLVSRLISAIMDVPSTIRMYKDLEEGYAECLAEEEKEKNQE